MPKFIKLKLNGLPKDEADYAISWRLVIDNVEDLNKYHALDATLNMEAFIGMEREKDGTIRLSHTGASPTRAIALQRCLQSTINCLPEGEKAYPIIEVAKITDKKYLGMLKTITNYGAIQIGEAGGYCPLDMFIKTWNGEILEEIEKESFGFPTNDAALQADTIILENSHKDYIWSGKEENVSKDIPDAGVVKTIFNLREVDGAYIMKCISNCKNVVIETQLQDDSQLDSFMGMFKMVSRKNIYLYVDKEVESRIRNHKHFAENSSIHNIKFLN